MAVQRGVVSASHTALIDDVRVRGGSASGAGYDVAMKINGVGSLLYVDDCSLL